MKPIFFFLMIMVFFRAQAQISGSVKDSASLQSLPYTTIRLLDTKEKLIRTTIADTAGNYTLLKIIPGKYLLRFSITGYFSKTINVFVKDSLGPGVPLTLLVRDQRNLEGITVTAQRPLVRTRIDGFQYDASNDVQAAGETGVDILRKLPGVQVDPNGIPSMRGSSRIRVYIDGQPSEAYAASVPDALRQIPAENILRIEIITQPSARYDAEGVDGVLNIFLKKPLSDGVSGSISGFVGNRNDQLSANMAIRKKQWIITSNVDFYYRTNELLITRNRYDKTGGSNVFQEQEMDSRNISINFGLTITRIIDSLTNASFGFRYGSTEDQINSVINYRIEWQGVIQDAFTRTINNPNSRTIFPLNWSFVRKSRDKTAEFSFLGNYFNQRLGNDYAIREESYVEQNDNYTTNKELALQLDLTKQFKNKTSLESGVKSAFRRFDNTSNFIPDHGRSQHFYFPRDIWAAYSTYSFDLDDWKFRIGARYEHTILSLNYADTSLRVPDYKNFLPNLLVSRSIDAHTISAGYSRKLLRPYLNYLNPVINYSDSLNLSYGNPYLDPELSNNIDLIYTWNKKNWLVSANLFYYQTNESIQQVTLLKPGGVIERTYLNIAQNFAYGISAQVNYRGKKFSFNTNNTLRYVDYKTANGISPASGFILMTFANISYKFKADLTVSAFLTLNTARIDLQGTTTGTRYYTFLATKSFNKGKYAFSIRIDNLFTHYQNIRETNLTPDFDLITDSRNIRRFFRIGFNYKFGKKEIRVAPVRTITGE